MSTQSHYHRTHRDGSLLVLGSVLQPPKPVAEAVEWVEQILDDIPPDSSPRRVTLDASEVQSVDSRGVLFVLEVVRRLRLEGVEAVLRSPPPSLTGSFATMGLSHYASIESHTARDNAIGLVADDFDHDADSPMAPRERTTREDFSDDELDSDPPAAHRSPRRRSDEVIRLDTDDELPPVGTVIKTEYSPVTR